MWPSRSITTDGIVHPMTGLLGADVVIEKKHFVALDYIIGTTTADPSCIPSGMRFRGHEFHYSKRSRIQTSGTCSRLNAAGALRTVTMVSAPAPVLGGHTHMYFGKKTATEAFCKQLAR